MLPQAPARTTQNARQLFRFTVPGLAQVPVLTGLQQILEITDLQHITPVPHTPAFMIGLSEWRGRVVTVLDLNTLLTDQAPALAAHEPEQIYAVGQFSSDRYLDLVAWPILPGSSTITAPPNAPCADLPDRITRPRLVSPLHLDGTITLLLYLEQLHTAVRHYRWGAASPTA